MIDKREKRKEKKICGHEFGAKWVCEYKLYRIGMYVAMFC